MTFFFSSFNFNFNFCFLMLLTLLTCCSRTDSKQGALGLGVVTRQDLIQRVTIAGSVVPLRKTIITAPYNGYVKKIYVQLGAKVAPSDPLVSVVQSLQSGDQVYPLRSPLHGRVVQIEKFEGEFVKEGDPKEFIMRIDDTSKLFITASAPEIDRVKLLQGQEAVVKASAILDRSYKGIVRELSLAAREKEQWGRAQAVEFPVRIEILNPDPQIHAGMSVLIDIITAKRSQVLVLRHEFIHREQDQYYVIKENNQKQAIKVGLQNEEGFEIVSGLKEGEKIKQIDFTELELAD